MHPTSLIPPMATTAPKKEASTGLVGYVGDVRKEMEKVNWPHQKELVNNTIITLVASLALALFIFGADKVISSILEVVYSI